jgi:hypothetical protein
MTTETRFAKRITGMGFVITIILGVLSIGWSQGQSKSYPQLLREALENGPKYEGTPTNVVDRGLPIPEAPFFLPAPAFRDPNAVTYLIGVLKDGEYWSDVHPVQQAYYSQQAQCYAALSLGYLKDPRGFGPLVHALSSPPDVNATKIGMSQAYDLRFAAAYGLAVMGDPNAIDPLIMALERKQNDAETARYERTSSYVGCLASFRDLRTLEPILKFSVEIGADATIWNSLEYLLHTEFFRDVQENSDGTYSCAAFPELGRQSYAGLHQTFWRHWLNGGGQKYAKEQFDTYYKRWVALKPEERSDSLVYYMTRGGILALPYVMEKIESGENGFEYALTRLTTPAMVRDENGNLIPKPNPDRQHFTSRAKAINWWKADKSRWVIDVNRLRTKIQPDKVDPNGNGR